MFSIIEIYIQKNLKELDEKPHLPGPHLLGRVHDLSHVHSKVTLATGVFILLFLIPLALKEPNYKYLGKITNLIPTSGILVILGMVSGILTHFAEEYFQNEFPPLIITAEVFQHVLIFPILLYASYKLYHQDFLRQFRSIMIFGFLGTFLNVLLSASLIYFIHDYSWMGSMTWTQTIVFASCISVVDPLSIAAVFKSFQVGKSKGNFVLPFGAALFGYGLAMQLFKAGDALAIFGDYDVEIPVSSYLYVALSIVTDIVFGIIIGVTCGLVSATITRFTSLKSQYFEMTITLGCALFGYILCVDFGFSYIFATICCGLVQERYTFMNMSPKSSMNTENFIFGISLICELSIIILVGYFVIHVEFSQVWDFALVSIVIIYIIRILVTGGLSFLLNMFRLSAISFKWQLLIFGGHRGPMSLAMVVAYSGPYHKLFKDTTLLVIVFSQIVDGVMARYLATQLKMRTNEKKTNPLHDFLVLSSIYGGEELGNMLRGDTMNNRTKWFPVIEKQFLRFFITDKEKLSNVYRIHAAEEQRQFFEKLEKHSYSVTAKHKENDGRGSPKEDTKDSPV